MREIGFRNCRTSREASTFADACKIDLVNTGRYAIQLKRSKKNLSSMNELFRIEHERYAEFMAASQLTDTVVVPRLVPMLISKIDNHPTLVAMQLDDLLPLITIK